MAKTRALTVRRLIDGTGSAPVNASNVREAIRIVQPFGLDLCSSVRTNGALDAVKLRAFVAAATSA